jgi:hypothetical protein
LGSKDMSRKGHAYPSVSFPCSPHHVIAGGTIGVISLDKVSRSHDRTTMTKSFIISRVRCTLVLPHQDVKDVDSRLCLRRVAGAQQGAYRHTLPCIMHDTEWSRQQLKDKSSKAIQFDTARSQRSNHTALASVKLHGGGELLLVPLERPIRL